MDETILRSMGMIIYNGQFRYFWHLITPIISVLQLKYSMASNCKIQRKSTTEKFYKQKKSLLKKRNELKQLCGAEVYILLCYHARYYVYTSTEQLA